MMTFMLLSSRAWRRGSRCLGYQPTTARSRRQDTVGAVQRVRAFPASISPAGDEFGDGRPSRLGTPMGGDRVMSHDPQLQDRPAQHYAGIRTTVPMDGISGAVDEAFPELFGWLAGNGIAPAGAPFIRYLVIDMTAGLQLDLGVPVSSPVAWSGRIEPGVLP